MIIFKKFLRAVGYVLLIFFISVAVSLGGGVPIPRSTQKKEDLIEVKIEMTESKDPQGKTFQLEIKQ